MRTMEVRATSRETIEPDSNEVHLLNPFKLSFLDQLNPPHYIPIILFYPKSTTPHPTLISSNLKIALSKTLNQFYPLSGRTMHNFLIDYYDQGVPYIEAHVNGCLSDYIGGAIQIQNLNHLLPLQPFGHLSDLYPLLAIQFNVFDCGGIALALCCSSKIMDSFTISAFLKTWSSFSRGSNDEIISPAEFLEPSSRFFPTRDWISPFTLSSFKQIWFKERRYTTKRFVFDADAVRTLMFKARSKTLGHPSREEILTAFIWKHAMLASRSASGRAKPSVITRAVDLRRKLKPRLLDHSIGNMIWFARLLDHSIGNMIWFATSTTYYNSAEKDIELHELAYIVRRSVENLNVEDLQSDEVFKVMSEEINMLSELALNGNADLYGFSSWLNYGMDEHDFGWGKPIWSAVPGVNNFTYLKEFGRGTAIEAWVTLDQKCLDILQNDHEFLAFASPNPCHDKVKI